MAPTVLRPGDGSVFARHDGALPRPRRSRSGTPAHRTPTPYPLIQRDSPDPTDPALCSRPIPAGRSAWSSPSPSGQQPGGGDVTFFICSRTSENSLRGPVWIRRGRSSSSRYWLTENPPGMTCGGIATLTGMNLQHVYYRTRCSRHAAHTFGVPAWVSSRPQAIRYLSGTAVAPWLPIVATASGPPSDATSAFWSAFARRSTACGSSMSRRSASKRASTG